MARGRAAFTAVSCFVFVCTVLAVYYTDYLHKNSPLKPVLNSSRLVRFSQTILLPRNQQSPDLDIAQLPVDIKPPTTTRVKILIVTYMRSGSTFTGDIYDSHPGVFYVFEPLHALSETDTTRSLHFWDNDTLKTSNMTYEDFARVKDNVIKGYFNCSFRAMYPKVLTDNFQFLGRKTLRFKNCVLTHPGILGPLRCLPLLQRLCFKSNVTVIKSLRYSLEEAFALMRKDPKVKVIHLLRDPRGTLISQLKLSQFAGSSLLAHCQTFCRNVEQNLTLSEEAREQFPGRVLRVRYEDIALDPFRYAKILLGFAGLKMAPKQEKHLLQITRSSSGTQCENCINVRTTNSSAEAFAWRKVCELNTTEKIDEYCSNVYRLAGYLPLAIESQLRDLTQPSMLPAGFVPGFWN
ncbi:carbohydrate sulfotransferase 6-like [Littorina saxatilis]|uniref:carbohydrate sulfotransferase 6-like n=1 Tax=Littorina saxatilis TaxID=31220 RepID=UPI0038B6515F